MKSAIEVFELVLLAYPDSADAHGNLADAYLAPGEKGLARQHAEHALAREARWRLSDGSSYGVLLLL